MTPEGAAALIEGVDYDDKYAMWGSFPDRYDPHVVYELAETVAGLHFEYAVQVPVATGVPDQPVWRYFIRRGADGGALLAALPGLGVWHVSEQEAERFAARHNITDYRIVRRLVSEPEVIS